MTDIERIFRLRIVVAASFLAGIFLAGNLFWNLHRIYPLAPLIPLLHATSWVDFLLTTLLVLALVFVIFSHKPKPYLILSIGITALLFLEDQNRIFPSFYEYFLIFLVFACYSSANTKSESTRRALNIFRLAVVFVYIWSGVQKLNPFFESQLSWVLAPLTHALPFLGSGFIQWGSVIAPLVEIEIGVGLLFKATRRVALAEAILMHVMLFLFIGPLRDTWHESAWIWNVASACIVFLLFFGMDDIGAKEIFFDFHDIKTAASRFVILITFGILPAFNLINLWDSALSFNVFSGNVAYADITLTQSTLQQLPAQLQHYALPITPDGAIEALDISRWTENEFHSEPPPEPRLFKNVAKFLCGSASTSSDINLTIHDKMTLFESPASMTIKHYTCANL